MGSLLCYLGKWGEIKNAENEGYAGEIFINHRWGGEGGGFPLPDRGGHLRCPVMESIILSKNGAETEKLRENYGIHRRGKVGGGVS